MKVRKVVIPVAGLGTRLLPATKSVPKEMLPLVDKPAIQYIVEEAVANGLNQVLMVTGRNKAVLENHFDRAVEVEHILGEKEDVERLSLVEESTGLAEIHYVRQGDPKGLGHAVLKSQIFVGDEPFALMLGDDVLDEETDLLTRMAKIAIERDANVVALMEVTEDEVQKYGIANYDASDESDLVFISGLVEKPSVGTAPSRMAVIGRYVLQPQIFEILATISPDRNQEIQLTDALDWAAKNPRDGGGVVGVVYSGDRHDIGDRLSYVKSIISVAINRKDIGVELKNWIANLEK